MKTFNYTITDEVGIHARPAGILVKEAKNYSSKIFISKGEKKAEATKLMAIMALGVKKDDTITVTIEGDDEDSCAPAIESFFKDNL